MEDLWPTCTWLSPLTYPGPSTRVTQGQAVGGFLEQQKQQLQKEGKDTNTRAAAIAEWPCLQE